MSSYFIDGTNISNDINYTVFNYFVTLLHLFKIYQNILVNLEQIKPGYEVIKNSVIDIVAYIRAVNKVRRHSLFGYISFLFVDVFPKVTKKSIEKEVGLLKANIERNEKGTK